MMVNFPKTIGYWQMDINGEDAKLVLKGDDAGNLSGTINDTQQVLGFWDGQQSVTFLRVVDANDPTSVQVFSGFLSSSGVGIDQISYSLVGTYQAFTGPGVDAQNNVFEWTASTTTVV